MAPKENQKSASDFDALDPRERGCSPLSTPKRMGSIQKIQAAALEDFLCSADFESLARRAVRISLCIFCWRERSHRESAAVDVVYHYDPFP